MRAAAFPGEEPESVKPPEVPLVTLFVDVMYDVPWSAVLLNTANPKIAQLRG